jgi:hypothetical protein
LPSMVTTFDRWLTMAVRQRRLPPYLKRSKRRIVNGEMKLLRSSCVGHYFLGDMVVVVAASSFIVVTFTFTYFHLGRLRRPAIWREMNGGKLHPIIVLTRGKELAGEGRYFS